MGQLEIKVTCANTIRILVYDKLSFDRTKIIASKMKTIIIRAKICLHFTKNAP